MSKAQQYANETCEGLGPDEAYDGFHSDEGNDGMPQIGMAGSLVED